MSPICSAVFSVSRTRRAPHFAAARDSLVLPCYVDLASLISRFKSLFARLGISEVKRLIRHRFFEARSGENRVFASFFPSSRDAPGMLVS
jgi:hypothetical protein